MGEVCTTHQNEQLLVNFVRPCSRRSDPS
jgi:hypothetical protein